MPWLLLFKSISIYQLPCHSTIIIRNTENNIKQNNKDKILFDENDEWGKGKHQRHIFKQISSELNDFQNNALFFFTTSVVCLWIFKPQTYITSTAFQTNIHMKQIHYFGLWEIVPCMRLTELFTNHRAVWLETA
jgi:hypothetical protein